MMKYLALLSLVVHIVFIVKLYYAYRLSRNKVPGGILFLFGLVLGIPSFIVSANGDIGDILGIRFGDTGGTHDAIASISFYLSPFFVLISTIGVVIALFGLIKIFKFALRAE